MRTKDQIIDILSQRKVSSQMNSSTWNDLVSAIQVYDAQQKERFVKFIIEGRHNEVGRLLQDALLANAEQRAKDEVSAMLADDTLSLTEIDELV